MKIINAKPNTTESLLNVQKKDAFKFASLLQQNKHIQKATLKANFAQINQNVLSPKHNNFKIPNIINQPKRQIGKTPGRVIKF